EAIHTWNVTCWDDRNNTNTSTTRNFTIDATDPNIVLNAPQPNETIKVNYVNFNWTATDNVATSVSCNLTLDGIVNVSNILSQNNTPVNYTVYNISDGAHYWNISCIDYANNTNTSETRRFVVDTVRPAVTLNFPPQFYLTKNTSINFNWTATNGIDTNLSCNLTINNIVNASNIASLNSTPTNYTVTGFADGSYAWNVSCTDDANNTNTSETRNFTVDATLPNASSPPDQTVDIGESTTIVWNITDNSLSGTYYVERNGVLFTGPSTWYNNTNIIVIPNTFFTGAWNYTIYYNDTAGNYGPIDTVFITVADNVTPSCSELINDPNEPSFVNITIDGDVTDWDPILTNGHINVVTDLTTAGGDLDQVATSDRDLVTFAYTWDDTNLYVYFRRLNAGNKQIPVITYLDYGLDGNMDATDQVVVFIWIGQIGRYTSYLYNYNPAGGSDPMLGSGYDMPGNITLNKTLETNIFGGTTPGIILEARINWTELGLSGPTPLIIQPASARGDATILPDQLEDNINTISTLYSSLLFRPDRTGSAADGTSVYYAHDLQNCGNLQDIIDLSALSNQGYNVTLYYPNGTVITDTNSYNGPDVTLDKDNYTTIIVKIDIPSGVPIGTVDTTIINATANNVNTTSKAVTDTTNIGSITIVPKTRSASSTAGSILFQNYTVSNYQDFTDVIEANVTSSQGWNITLLYENNTVITDTDGDGHTDFGSFLPSESKIIKLKIEIPPGASIGTNDISTIRINSSVTPSITTTAIANTTVTARLTIEPDYNRSVGIGDSTYYLLTVTNSWNESDVIDITYTNVSNWNTTFLQADHATPLTDTDNDSIIDTGVIPPNGGTFSFYVQVRVPANATDRASELTTVIGNSSLNTSVFDIALLNTTARILVTYQDAARSIEQRNFEVTQTVYARANSLTGINNVYFEWIDPNSTVIRTSPDIPVSAEDNADDMLTTNISLVVGNWTLVVFDALNDAEIGRTEFYLLDSSSPIITPLGCTPDPANRFDNVTCSATVTDNYGIDTITANVTLPNSTSVLQNLSCTGTILSKTCSFTYAQTDISGLYNVTWFANDTTNNVTYAFDNFTVRDNNPVVTLVAPPAGYFDLNPLFNVTFNCSATDDFGLVNISLYLTNSTDEGFALNQTTNVSGLANSTSWTLELVSGTYTWNCLAYDNIGQFDWGDQNRTITNVTPPAPPAGGPTGPGGGGKGWDPRFASSQGIWDVYEPEKPAPEKPEEPKIEMPGFIEVLEEIKLGVPEKERIKRYIVTGHIWYTDMMFTILSWMLVGAIIFLIVYTEIKMSDHRKEKPRNKKPIVRNSQIRKTKIKIVKRK
ncbi:hypothetical protein KY326_00850, partial [Candidatus Woesearchaeota archaeon]|nr:hypothetical protein [Candidatus Woesearchaeota archaeon]